MTVARDMNSLSTRLVLEMKRAMSLNPMVRDDIALGDSGDDYLALGQGADIGLGGAGSDTLDGGLGNDTLFGDFNWDAGPATDGETENERLIRVANEENWRIVA